MKSNRKKSADPLPQIEKFRQLARELECDEDESAFEERFKNVARGPKAPEKVAERK